MLIFELDEKYVKRTHLLDQGQVVGLHLLDIDPDLALAVEIILAAKKKKEGFPSSGSAARRLGKGIRERTIERREEEAVAHVLEYFEPLEVLPVLLIHQVCVCSCPVQCCATHTESSQPVVS